MNPKQSTWKAVEPENAHQLPSQHYYDEGLYQEELKKIVYPGWHMACHGNEIPEVGDYVLLDICGQSIIVFRAAPNQINAFYNVCKHRGNPLVEKPHGKIGRMLRCPNHAWCFGLDGELRSAPCEDQVEGFDRSKFGLTPVRVEELSYCVFVNLDMEAQSLAEMIPGAEQRLSERFPDLKDMQLLSKKDYVIDANWKIVIENAIEGYHFKFSDMGPYHKELCANVTCDAYDPSAFGNYWIYQGIANAAANEPYGQKLGDSKYQSEWFFNMQIWPMTTLFTFPYTDFFGTFNLMPVGPEKTRIGFNYYHPSRAISKVTEAAMEFQTNLLGPEDIQLNEMQQRGMRSFGYDAGPYMVNKERNNWSEHLLYHFHSLIHEALQRD